MESPDASPFSDDVQNMVENLAFRVARETDGPITANHLAPHLPMSLGLIEACLNQMADGDPVRADTAGHVTQYLFPPQDAPADSSAACLACGADMPGEAGRGADPFCPACFDRLRAELNALAEKMGWPAQAVYEHEILYLAAQRRGPVHAEELAGQSRLTLRAMRRKLDLMSRHGRLEKVFDEARGAVAYRFPAIAYDKAAYGANRTLIRSYPASVMEEVEIRVAHMFFAWGALALVLFVLAFLHVPYPLLTLAFLVGAPLLGLIIWRRRGRPGDESND